MHDMQVRHGNPNSFNFQTIDSSVFISYLTSIVLTVRVINVISYHIHIIFISRQLFRIQHSEAIATSYNESDRTFY